VQEMCKEMVVSDLEIAQKHVLLERNGFGTLVSRE
jgi:hypothetical protein